MVRNPRFGQFEFLQNLDPASTKTGPDTPLKLDFSLSSVGIKAAGRTSILRLNYRNTREILQFACDFASKFMDAKAADDDHIPMVHPESGGLSGPGPLSGVSVFRLPSARCISKRSGKDAVHSHWSFRTHRNTELPKHRNTVLPHLHMANRTAKRAYDPRKPQVNILSVQSSKGLEFRSVIFIGLGQIDASETQAAQNMKLLYKASPA